MIAAGEHAPRILAKVSRGGVAATAVTLRGCVDSGRARTAIGARPSVPAVAEATGPGVSRHVLSMVMAIGCVRAFAIADRVDAGEAVGTDCAIKAGVVLRWALIAVVGP